MKLGGTIRFAHVAAGVALVLLGTAHVGLTPRFYPLNSFGSLWFAGAGLMVLTAGALNLLVARIRTDAAALWTTVLVDLLGGAYALWVTRMLRQPHAWIALGAFALATVCAVMRAASRGRGA